MYIDIEKNFVFHKNDIIVIGCSTGPDSMALLDMLLSVRKKNDLSIICAHVNHNVRKQSLEELKFIDKFCKEKDITFETMTIEKYGDDNFQNEARNIRYQFFEDIVNKYNANYLMTAHHGDDLIETILMRITRGSNLQGYSGFKKVVEMDNYKIVRPLIYYTKQELLEYDNINKVEFFIDDSNSKMKYTRNRYRKNVLPFLKEEDSKVHEKFLKFSETLSGAYLFIERKRDKAIEAIVEDGNINIDKFLKIDTYLQREVLYYLVAKFYQDDLILIGDKHIDLLLDLINSKKSNLVIDLPNDVNAIKNYNYFSLVRNSEEVNNYEIEFDKYAQLPNGHIIELIDETSENSNDICRLNSGDVKLPLIIRTRKVGDKIFIKGLNGKKKVKDIFIDKKIDPKKRELWPIVVDSVGNIVWIPRLKKSKFDIPKKEKYDIILKYH